MSLVDKKYRELQDIDLYIQELQRRLEVCFCEKEEKLLKKEIKENKKEIKEIKEYYFI